jgi:hypothetical protein
MCPRIANVCIGSPCGSKLTRMGARCQTGARQAESGAASSGMAAASDFFRTGLWRFSCATTAKVFLPSSETPQ